VPARVPFDLGRVARLDQVKQLSVLRDRGNGPLRQIGEHRAADTVEPLAGLLQQLQQVGVAAAGDDRAVQPPVAVAELGRVGGPLHLGGELAQLRDVRGLQVRGRVGGGGALKDRHRGHLLLPRGGVDRRDDRAHVRLEPHPAFGLEAAQRLADRDRADAELPGERVDVQPGLRRVRAGVDPVPQHRIGPLLLVHASSLAETAPPGLCAITP